MCADAPLCAVARFVLERGAVRLQDAVNLYETAGGCTYTHSTRFLEHLLRHLPLSAFSGARKLGWMLFERTIPSRSSRATAHIQRNVKGDVSRARAADEGRRARVLETKACFGITNSDVVVSKIDNSRVRFDSAEGGCADTALKNSRVAAEGRACFLVREAARCQGISCGGGENGSVFI